MVGQVYFYLVVSLKQELESSLQYGQKEKLNCEGRLVLRVFDDFFKTIRYLAKVDTVKVLLKLLDLLLFSVLELSELKHLEGEFKVRPAHRVEYHE